MRILQVVSSYLPAIRYGGTIVSVHGLSRALAARGHDVHVYTTSVDGPGDSPVPHGEPVDVDGVKVWYFRSEHLRRLYWAPDLRRALRANVATFDIVHTHAVFLWPLWAAAREARRANVPYVVSPRGMLERDLISRKNPLLKGIWIAAIERHNLARAAAMHVTSRREADEAAALGFTLPPMREVPNGVSDDNDPSGPVSPAIAAIANGEPFVLFLGRINWKKGLDRLIAALPFMPCGVVIAGNDEDDYRGTLEAQAAKLGVSTRVTFTGAVHGADKQALLTASRMLVLPSYSENFGNVVIEAMAAGCPVVVSKEVGLAATLIESGAGVVTDGEAQSLGMAITHLLEDPAARATLAALGRALVHDRFSWEVVAEQMEQVYALAIAAEKAA